MQFVRYLAFVAFAAIPFGGCSSSDDTSPGTGTPDNTPDERRVSLGKADSLSGKCSASGHSYCGGKSKGKCWCPVRRLLHGLLDELRLERSEEVQDERRVRERAVLPGGRGLCGRRRVQAEADQRAVSASAHAVLHV